MLEILSMESQGAGQARFRAGSLSLSCLNHISRTCSDLSIATNFYENLLGFVRIQRPGSLDVDGAWLYNYGIGIHLLQSDENLKPLQKLEINPKSEHISFQCDDMNFVETQLQENGVPYVLQRVEDGGIWVDQLFFHDPDGFMIEVCNCDQLPVVPLACSNLQSPCASRKSQQSMFGSTAFERKSAMDLSGAIPMVSITLS